MNLQVSSYIPRLGEYVTLLGANEWGIGQVQSVVGLKITINFEHAGKRVIDLANAQLVAADIDNDVH
ncbi:DUF3553 domain-containing protein [Curvivirga sp.]|uniref:DUF3553 domain-containing protein n=1 Tax=Curvivirga sp. TaxID=2856848 RepID=UPI003B599766